MKKLIIFALLAVMMVGCRFTRTEPNVLEASNPMIIVDENTLDSYEYYPGYGHKGDCKYCAARRKAELKELIKQLKQKRNE